MPATVILAGVLLVVAFGLVLSRAVRDDPPPTVLLPQPPALPAETTPADQAVIPLPSPSRSRPAPSGAGPAPSRSRSTPAASRTVTPPPLTSARPERVTIDRDAVPDRVDLSAEGSRDWVHWGSSNATSPDRAADGGSAIREGAPDAPRFRHAFVDERFSWRDGSPVRDSDGTPTGIRTCGDGNGFTLSAPAGRAEGTLRLYVGVFAARGRLEARLSTGGATHVARLEERSNVMRTAVYMISYRAPRDGRIELRWTTEDSFNPDCGGVALQAAALR